MNQNTKKTSQIISLIQIAASIFMVLAVKVIAPVCTGMIETAAGKQVFMKCHFLI